MLLEEVKDELRVDGWVVVWVCVIVAVCEVDIEGVAD